MNVHNVAISHSCCDVQLGSHYKPIILGETAAKAIKELKKKIISNRGQTNGKEEARNDKAVASES